MFVHVNNFPFVVASERMRARAEGFAVCSCGLWFEIRSLSVYSRFIDGRPLYDARQKAA